MTITWNAVSGATSYDVYWATSAGVTKASTRIPGATSPYVHTGRTNDVTYHYVVTAVNADGESAESAEVSATPSLNPAPAAPTGVTATAGNGKVTLSWSAVTGATSYDVYRGTAAGVTPGTGTQLAGVSSPFDDTGRTNGVTYYYVVTAVNANGESTASSEVSATPSSAPSIKAFVLTLQGGGVPPFGFLEQVRICTDDTCSVSIDTATATVNGTPLTFDASNHQYVGTFNVALGATVTLHVTIGAESFTATATQLTTPPTVTAPSASATWTAANASTISWTGGAPTTGASYIVGVLDGSGHFVFPAGDHGPEEVPLSSTSVAVPANTLVAGPHQVLVAIGTTGLVDQTSGGIAIPGASGGSGLWLGAIAPLVPVTVQ